MTIVGQLSRVSIFSYDVGDYEDIQTMTLTKRAAKMVSAKL